ncbi:MAG TPA: cytochrome c [Steroidobacteraceae bacterium]|jgi:mono/diheme cytochrome c family protein|nr:cytochrome c [Steroidobacteraceae bacterium]
MMRILHGCALSLALVCLNACDEMVDQPRQSPYSMPAAMPPEHTVQFETAAPLKAPPVTLALLEHGQERYHVFCAPCHSELGDGRGMVVQRGFPAPPPFDSAQVRALRPQQLFDVISNGYGIMYSFAGRVPSQDRWAIVAYVYALSLSQHADEPHSEGGSP